VEKFQQTFGLAEFAGERGMDGRIGGHGKDFSGESHRKGRKGRRGVAADLRRWTKMKQRTIWESRDSWASAFNFLADLNVP
jgi:hypothetical protein